MGHQHATLEDTVYLWFAANDTSGSGGDGSSPAADIRLAGATISDAPILSPTPGLLSHVNYPAGCHEVAVAATAANGFAAAQTYGVFCTLAIDSQNPSGFIGSFTLDPIISNVKEINDSSNAAIQLGRSAGTMVFGTVDTTAFTPTATQFESDDIVEATATHYVGRNVAWLTGALIGQYNEITGYSFDGTRSKFTITSATEAAANNDTFEII